MLTARSSAFSTNFPTKKIQELSSTPKRDQIRDAPHLPPNLQLPMSHHGDGSYATIAKEVMEELKVSRRPWPCKAHGKSALKACSRIPVRDTVPRLIEGARPISAHPRPSQSKKAPPPSEANHNFSPTPCLEPLHEHHPPRGGGHQLQQLWI